MPFTGKLRLTIVEALGLKPTELLIRNSIIKNTSIDPYVYITVDDSLAVDKTTAKERTFNPIWNEVFSICLLDAKSLQLTVFNDSLITDDDFLANCSISFDEFKLQAGNNEFD